MNVGAQTIEWLFSEQLKVDREWSVRTATGFRWWADRNAQTIEVIGEEEGPRGEKGYLISVRTDLLRSLVLNDRTLSGINTLLMGFASMTGPVYDPTTRSLSLCSLVRVYESIKTWMNPLISVAAVLQIGEARIMATEVAGLMGAEPAISGHPQQGQRRQPDEMAELIATLIGPLGKQPCRWPTAEFESTVQQFAQKTPALRASARGTGFTVEFPFGNESSLCVVTGDAPHPRYGNGLFCLQSFPVGEFSESEGIKLALTLNATELNQKPSGYGFGSYVYRDNMLHFTCFFPNALYRPGLLPNLYFANGARAREMSVRFAKRQ